MNIKSDIWIGKKGYRFWYYRFRDSEYYPLSIIIIAIFVSLILLFTFIIPEVSQWFSIQDEVTATQQQITVLQQNINFINNLDKNKLNTQLQTVSHALPPEKNFGFMVNALSNAAANSGVSLNDYAFQVGNLSGTKDPTTGIQQNGMSVIEITVIVNGSLDKVNKFIQSLQTSLPLSSVTTINGAAGNVSMKIQFYSRPFSKVTFTGDTPLEGVSAKNSTLLQTLSKWDTTTNSIPQQPTSSGSAETVPLF